MNFTLIVYEMHLWNLEGNFEVADNKCNIYVKEVVVEEEVVVVEHDTEPENTDNMGSVGTGLVGIRVDKGIR